MKRINEKLMCVLGDKQDDKSPLTFSKKSEALEKMSELIQSNEKILQTQHEGKDGIVVNDFSPCPIQLPKSTQ